ncbi:ATP synthase-coupling factor 6, mitochondrial isoform X2 [Erinaceus europaeus]|uniref:ATP synthase-coupling factor 6, mitochondrial isoform X2 n=1 Tax=Erinaceus europaeus TaxID=9365 RepID=A0ABM3Y0E5_ERIEU|nr:ATP synthase-coupling factor 6, mitochondrial isoform X2 [Erinaceus europaeus]
MGVTEPGTSGNKTHRRLRGGPQAPERGGSQAGPRGARAARPPPPAAALTRSGVGRPCRPRPRSRAGWEAQWRGLHVQRLSRHPRVPNYNSQQGVRGEAPGQRGLARPTTPHASLFHTLSLLLRSPTPSATPRHRTVRSQTASETLPVR